MSEAERLYNCIMHDFHDGVDRRDMWVKELQLVVEKSYRDGFSEGQDSMLYNGQIELVTIEDARKMAIDHADKVIGTDIKSAIGNFNEKDAKAHASVQEFCDFVNYHKAIMRRKNKL